MSICDNTAINKKTPLKLQSIGKTKACRNTYKKTSNDSEIMQWNHRF